MFDLSARYIGVDSSIHTVMVVTNPTRRCILSNMHCAVFYVGVELLSEDMNPHMMLVEQHSC